MSVCIEFKDVSYAYPLTNKAAVKHLNCKLESGKCYGIIGPNAGGKTTFCNLMRGLCPKFYGGILKGDVIVNGKSTREWEDEELSIQIGYVFQDPFAQVSGIKETVFEEIGMGLENLGVETEEMIQRILEISKMVNVESLLQKNPLALSGGQCQRVAFASVLALNSDIIVIDEPTSQLDPSSTNDVFEIISALKNQLLLRNIKWICLLNTVMKLLQWQKDELLLRVIREKCLQIQYSEKKGCEYRRQSV